MNEPRETATNSTDDQSGHPATAAIGRAIDLLRRQDVAGAARLVADLAQRYPLHPPLLALEGHLALARRDRAEARVKYETALAGDPTLAPALINLGLLLSEAGEYEPAIEYLRRAQAIRPDDPEILINLGAVEQRRSNPRAIAAYRRALELRPDDRKALRALGLAYGNSGQAAAAERCFRRLVELRPNDAEARLQLGRQLANLGRFDEAADCYRAMGARDPRQVDGHLALAGLARSLGRIEASAEHYAAALRVDPINCFALAGLLRTGRAGAREVALAGDEGASPRRTSRDRAVLHFALYHRADAAGATGEAYRHLVEANRLRRDDFLRRGRPYDRARQRHFIARSESVCDAAWVRRALGFEASAARPIFIVGMPRSGTTLCEQILAAHSRIRAAGERVDIVRIGQELAVAVGDAYPDCLAALTPDRARAAAADYLAAREIRDGAIGTDKAPTNFRHLGLIAAMFPGARIVYCRRDPMDVGFSCFEQNFGEAYSWCWDLAEIGDYYACHERLMRHWRAVLPVPILDWPYAAVVEDFEPWVRRLLEFCGLDWEPACLDFAAVDRRVATASTEQVRQPLYATSVGKWRRYASELAPLAAALASSRAELGIA